MVAGRKREGCASGVSAVSVGPGRGVAELSLPALLCLDYQLGALGRLGQVHAPRPIGSGFPGSIICTARLAQLLAVVVRLFCLSSFARNKLRPVGTGKCPRFQKIVLTTMQLARLPTCA